jgi:hypothetical protein
MNQIHKPIINARMKIPPTKNALAAGDTFSFTEDEDEDEENGEGEDDGEGGLPSSPSQASVWGGQAPTSPLSRQRRKGTIVQVNVGVERRGVGKTREACMCA